MPYHPGETENDEEGGTEDIITQGGAGDKHKVTTTKNTLKTDPKMDSKSTKKKSKSLTADGGGTDLSATGSIGNTIEKIELVTGGVSKRVGGTVSLALHETAMQQAVDLWSPLMGSCLPEWSLPHMEGKDVRALQRREDARNEVLKSDLARPDASSHPSALVSMATAYGVPYDALRPQVPHILGKTPIHYDNGYNT